MAFGGAESPSFSAASLALHPVSRRRPWTPTKGWATVVPPEAWLGGLAASLVIGSIAGFMPALRAARMSPTQALWSVCPMALRSICDEVTFGA